jgi:hypothetical protein
MGSRVVVVRVEQIKGRTQGKFIAVCFMGPPSPLATIGEHIPATQLVERLRERDGLGNHCWCLC